MSNKVLSLGRIGAAGQAIGITGATNATPIVVTLTANSGLKSGDRIAIAGVTGNTGANGEWTLEVLTATTARLLNSVGNGTYGGTPRVAVICDTTPQMVNHSNALNIGGNLVGTVDIEAYETYGGFALGANPTGTAVAPALSPSVGTNTNGNTTTIAAKTTIVNQDSGIEFEVKLAKYMRMNVTAFTSGAINADLVG